MDIKITLDLKKDLPDITDGETTQLQLDVKHLVRKFVEEELGDLLKKRLRSQRRDFHLGDKVLTAEGETLYISHIFTPEKWNVELDQYVPGGSEDAEYELRDDDGHRIYKSANENIIVGIV